MKIVSSVSVAELKDMADKMYGRLVKADVDVSTKTVIIDMEMHSDGEAQLLKNGSKQIDLWGINLYPHKFGTDEFVEYDSMINLKPHQNNLHRGIDDPAIRQQIIDIISEVVHE